jgi:hypothetical protein
VAGARLEEDRVNDDDRTQQVRTVGSIFPGDDTAIWVDYVCTMEAGHPDEDFVGIMIQEAEAAASASALLTAGEALLLADRLTRGAHLVLENGEDLPDAEREYQLPGRPRPAGDENG